ncbi:hypothetical protein CFELI_02275 [Corynebacterium felinum]|uniref:Uncharacterized protein n=1 Tax=Corynebacterium felinum TaxID=131318 RepID=A0ABU2B9S6_9CORY|nr:hypothetical protein [Corynebacterium felinum]WJY94097.1 hypothetical protein CFELI_02275 [Corynebacterium felinum]
MDVDKGRVNRWLDFSVLGLFVWLWKFFVFLLGFGRDSFEVAIILVGISFF